ncbi:UNVERIFIED_CONTAM: protein tas [Sesamum radiatum]|uniref:Protein tas n=1 Tax=Sesamum radiatum TaxID=300843 RepID=A0AAW2UPR9_SESRA
MAVPLFNLAPDMSVSRLCLGFQLNTLYSLPFLNACISLCEADFRLFGLGTMTFGEQNSLPQSFQLLDKAFDSGVNFFDSAEMYPVPQRAETQGRSEEYLGRWIRCRNIPRDRVVLATKVSGPSGQMTWIRDGPESLDAGNVAEALDDSYVPMFGETEYDPTRTFSSVSFEEQLTALEKAITAGKIRYIGLSNETPYGLMKFLHVAEGLSINHSIVSVQNSYNLLCRNFDSGMAECCHHERISLLAYSPLAMGILSGKYLSLAGGPADGRLNLFKGRYAEGESRYNLSNVIIRKATELYFSIAKNYGVHPVSLAIETWRDTQSLVNLLHLGY